MAKMLNELLERGGHSKSILESLQEIGIDQDFLKEHEERLQKKITALASTAQELLDIIKRREKRILSIKNKKEYKDKLKDGLDHKDMISLHLSYKKLYTQVGMEAIVHMLIVEKYLENKVEFDD